MILDGWSEGGNAPAQETIEGEAAPDAGWDSATNAGAGKTETFDDEIPF